MKGTGNQLDYGARVYDPRVGRFLSIDPLQAKYAMLTPYHFTANNPTNYTDVDGKDTIRFNKYITKYTVGGMTNWSGRNEVVVKPATGEDVFYYNVINQSIAASGVSTNIKTTQFYPNSAGSQLFSGGSGVTQSPSTNWPGVTVNDNDFTSLAKLSSPGLIAYLEKHDPKKYGGLGLHNAGIALEEGVRNAADVALIFEGGVLMRRPDYTVDPKKFDYFFGRVKSSAHNAERSVQNLNDLKVLGIENNSDLIKVFDKAFQEGNVVKTTTNSYGTTVVKSAQAGEGSIRVGFFYEGGNMSSVPKVSSIIPKLPKQ